MGVCYQGKTVKELMEERDRLYEQTGHYWGLERLPLNENDPIKLTRLHSRITAACIAARETAKPMSGSPTMRTFGECVWMLGSPEGDVVSASLGLSGHTVCFPWILRKATQLGYEEKGEIRDGAIYFCNDPAWGVPHTADCYTFIPIFYKGELISWGAGAVHISDVGGAINPGSMQAISPTVFTEGFLYPMVRVGENFEFAVWWEHLWMTQTRLGTVNILDDKARLAGVMMIRDRVFDIIEEFGIDYYRQAIKEVIERERRIFATAVTSETVPGRYRQPQFRPTFQKGLVPWMVEADRDWISHIPTEFNIYSNGKLFVDHEGVNTEEWGSYNMWPGGVWLGLSWWYIPAVVRATEGINSSPMYQIKVNAPEGSCFNPKNPFVGRSGGAPLATRLPSMYHSIWSKARYARGVVEEALQFGGGFAVSGLSGIFDNGMAWAMSDFTWAGTLNTGGAAYKDGESFLASTVNPQSDAGEIEEWDLYQPPLPTVAKGVYTNCCGHGKYRGGLLNFLMYIVFRPGKGVTLSNVSNQSITDTMCGNSGGYPAPSNITLFFHNTNMMELIEKGEGYPGDPAELYRWIDEGKLKVESITITPGDVANVVGSEGDIWISAAAGNGGWGDPLERDLRLVEQDLELGYMTSDVVNKVYGVIANQVDGHWRIDEAATEKERDAIRKRRREKAVPFREWWKNERELILKKEFKSPIHIDFHRDLLKWGKSRADFIGTWQLGDDYQL